MNLNKKGYMLVEIIIAGVLAVSISFYLLNLTYKFKNNNEDLFQSYLYTKDKNLVTKNIMNDLDRGSVMRVAIIESEDKKYKAFTFNLKIFGTNDLERRRLAITKNDDKTIIEYGLVKSTDSGDEEFIIEDKSYYRKELESNFIIGDLEFEIPSDEVINGTVTFKIPIKSIYSDNDYSIKLYAEYYSLNLMKRLFTDETSTDYYKSPLYRNNIIEASFIKSTDTSNAIILDTGKKYWDLSFYEDGNIIAWLEDSGTKDENGLPFYKLYIGSNNKIYSDDLSYLFQSIQYLEKISFDNLDTSMVTDMHDMFSHSISLEELDLRTFNTSNVTDMSLMFSSCESLKNLNLESFDTSKVINMYRMFENCQKLTTLNLENFNTSNVEEMNQMFFNCKELTTLNLENFDTSKVNIMEGMFSLCSKLETLNLNNFDTSNVTDMSYMFNCCSSLTELKIESFNTSNVTSMNRMFAECSNLTSLNLSNFDTSKVDDMFMMFFGCNKLSTTITIKNPATSEYSDMFMSSATTEGTKIIVNYTENTKSLVENMISTKSPKSNVELGNKI